VKRRLGEKNNSSSENGQWPGIGPHRVVARQSQKVIGEPALQLLENQVRWVVAVPASTPHPGPSLKGGCFIKDYCRDTCTSPRLCRTESLCKYPTAFIQVPAAFMQVPRMAPGASSIKGAYLLLILAYTTNTVLDQSDQRYLPGVCKKQQMIELSDDAHTIGDKESSEIMRSTCCIGPWAHTGTRAHSIYINL
jgi:hypothetical protein